MSGRGERQPGDGWAFCAAMLAGGLMLLLAGYGLAALVDGATSGVIELTRWQ